MKQPLHKSLHTIFTPFTQGAKLINVPILLIITIIFCCIHLMALIPVKSVKRADAKINDVFFKLRYLIKGNETITRDIIHVDLTDEDVHDLNILPHDRSVYAKIIDILNEAGVDVIVVDIIFKDTDAAITDKTLINATSRANMVYYPIVLDINSEKNADLVSGSTIQKLLMKHFYTPQIKKEGDPYSGRVYLSPFEELSKAARGLGHITCNPDADGFIRRIPLVIKKYDTPDTYIPSLTFKAICDYLSVDPADIEVTFGTHIILKNAHLSGGKITDITIPIDSHGQMILNWVGKAPTFRHYSFSKLLQVIDNEHLAKQLKLIMTGKLVVLSDMSTSNQDIGINVYNNVFPLNDIYSTIMNTIITRNFIHSPKLPGIIILTVLLMVLLYFAAVALRPVLFIPACMAIYIMYIMGNILLFLIFKRLTYVVTPSAAFISTSLIIIIYRLILEGQEKQELTINNKVEQAKRLFIQNISYEYNTPISLMLSYLNTLIQTDGHEDQEAVRQTLTILTSTMKKLSVLSKHIADLAKLDTGKLTLTLRSLDIVDYLRQLTYLFKLNHPGNPDIIFKSDREKLSLCVDPVKFETIITRLLSHCVTFTKPETRITITVTRPQSTADSTPTGTKSNTASHQTIITITDHGPVIPDNELTHVFNYTATCTSVRLFGNAGIELHLIKKYVELHQGSISVTSNKQKTEFILHMPPGTDRMAQNNGTIKEDPHSVVYGQTMAEILDTCIPGDTQSHNPPHTSPTPYYHKILIIEYDTDVRNYLCGRLSPLFTIITAPNGKEGLIKARKHRPDLIISNMRIPGLTADTLLNTLKKDRKTKHIPIMILADDHSRDTTGIPTIIEPEMIITLPITAEALTSRIKTILAVDEASHLVIRPKSDTGPSNPDDFATIITNNAAMKTIFKDIESIAVSSRPVLIIGESGVGKELIADVIDKISRKSGNRPGKFIKVNLGGRDKNLVSSELFGHKKGAYTNAVSDREGLIARAKNGTIFLDEIGDIDLDVQVKLLRLIENNEYIPLGYDEVKTSTVRIIAATNVNLKQKMTEGSFRKDLYYRLKAHTITIPPLRERVDDIPLLTNNFIDQACRTLGKKRPVVPSKLFDLFQSYSFPGNIRELESIVFDAVNKCEGKSLCLTHFTNHIEEHTKMEQGEDQVKIIPGGDKDITITGGIIPFQELEDMYITKVRRMAKTNLEAARLLGMHVNTISRKLKEIEKRKQK